MTTRTRPTMGFLAQSIIASAFLIASPFLVASPASAGKTENFTWSTEMISDEVVPTHTLIISSPGGSITIEPSDQNIISLKATLEMVNVDKRNMDRFAQETKVTLEPRKDSYQVIVKTPESIGITLKNLPRIVRGCIEELKGGGWNYFPSAEVDLEIKIPRDMPAQIETSYGNVSVTGISGEIEIVNESGEVTLQDIGGGAKIRNSYGKVS
ncbi:MAG: hypothetical protein KJ831_11640, partial [Candidatus Eisenbacteria bacterium]|nr:hypothetical protein [Candidatus Eisenbacteria bacterium]